MIDESTLYIIRKEYLLEIVYYNKRILLDRGITKFLNDNCNYYGSSYLGRKSATKYLIGITSKAPIVLNERKMLVIFPLYSLRNEKCIWIIYNNILSYKKVNKNVEVTFKNGLNYTFEISYNIFNQQFLKCSKLIAIYSLRN